MIATAKKICLKDKAEESWLKNEEEEIKRVAEEVARKEEKEK